MQNYDIDMHETQKPFSNAPEKLCLDALLKNYNFQM